MTTAIYFLLVGLWTLIGPLTASAAPDEGDSTYSKETPVPLAGQVVESGTGEQLPFVIVAVRGTTISTTTDVTGHYSFSHLPEGTFEVVVSASGYRSTSAKLTFKKGETLEHDFKIEEESINLSGVVVSANRQETARRMAPTLVNVLSPETFEVTHSVTLSQGLNFQPGVRVETNCQNCGFQQVRINGLDGPYTQILVDSRPVFSALAGVYGLEQIPANMIDRVEVMRGGGSALFGSSAIAGTINIITKEPLRNSASLSHTVTGIGELGSFDHNTMLNTSLVTDNHKLGIALFGQSRSRQGYDDNGDGYTELPELKSTVLGLRSYVRTSDYSRISFEYHHISEYRRGGDSLRLPPHQANIAEQLNHTINSGGLKFDMFSPNTRHRLGIFTSAQHVDRDSYYGGGQDLNAYGSTKDLTWVAGTQYNYHADKCLFMPADFTAGFEYNQDQLEDNQPGYHRHTRQTVRIFSALAQNEWKTDAWSLLIGARMDKHNLLDKPVFSPRANLRYNPTENINLRASYSYGFRAPQAFDEDLHVENVGGTVSMIRLADHLKQEKSQSLSASADMYRNWGEWQVNLLVEGFYTDIRDVFALTRIGEENGVIILERGNEKGARVYGGTLEGKLAWRNILQCQAGFTFQQAKYKEARRWTDEVEMEKRIFRTPDTYGYFTMTVTPVRPLSLSLSGTYTGPMLVEHNAGVIETSRTEETRRFLDMGFKATYDFKVYRHVNMQVNIGVQNMFDAYQKDFDMGPDRDSAYIYGPGMPRSFYAGVKLSY